MHGTNRRSEAHNGVSANGNADTQDLTKEETMSKKSAPASVTTHIFTTKGRYICGKRPDPSNSGALFARNADCQTCLSHGN
jgi:hypothetical protein